MNRQLVRGRATDALARSGRPTLPRTGLCHLAPLALALALGTCTCRRDSPAPPAGPQPAVLAPATKRVLANGLEVLVLPDPRAPIVFVAVWYKAGAKDEPPSKAGLAHLVEHVMFRGTRHLGPNHTFELLATGAADESGTVTHDRTLYAETLPASELELALWLESSRMGFLLDQPAFDQSVALQREVITRERQTRISDLRAGVREEVLWASIYDENLQGHPYGHPVLGTEQTLARLGRADVEDFYRRHYGPENATLIMAGDVDAGAAHALAVRYFGAIPRGPARPRQPIAPAPRTSQSRVEIAASDARHELTLAWPTVPIYQHGHQEAALLAVVLAEGRDSRLRRALANPPFAAWQVEAAQVGQALAGHLEVSVFMAPEDHPTRFLRKIDAEIDRLRRAPVTEAELRRAKDRRRRALVHGLDDLRVRAVRMLAYNHLAGDPLYLERELAEVEAVTPAALQAAAQRFLTDGRTLLYVRPSPAAPRAGVVVTRSKPGGRVPAVRASLRAQASQPEQPAAAHRVTPDAPFRHQRPPEGSLSPRPPAVRTFALSNGLPIAFAEAPLGAQVRARAIAAGGMLASPPHAPELAAVAMDAVADGTQLGAPDLESELDRLSATLAVGSATDTSFVQIAVAPPDAQAALALWARAVTWPCRALPQDAGPGPHSTFSRGRWDGARSADDALNAFTWARLLGWPRGGEQVRLERRRGGADVALRDQYCRQFRADNVAIALSGPLPEAEARAQLEALLGGWRAPERPASAPQAIAAPMAERRLLLLPTPGATQAAVRIVAAAPGRAAPDSPAFLVLDAILSGPFARIERTLREEKGWAYYASSSLLEARTHAMWALEGRFPPERVDGALEVMLDNLRQLGADGPRDDELARAKRVLRLHAARTEANGFDAAALVATSLLSLPGRHVGLTARLPRIQGVTAGDVRAAARTYLAADRLMIIVAGDRHALEVPLRRRGPVEIWVPETSSTSFVLDEVLPPS